jgi:hypothetical protein
MRKIIYIFAVIFFMNGCCWLNQPAVWKDYDHMKYSMHGYKHTSKADVEKSKKQCWWGCPVEVDNKDEIDKLR